MPAAQATTQTQPTTQEKPLTSTDQMPLFADDADSEPDPEADEAISSEPSESDTSTFFTFN
jgi:hypothetical protein